MADLTARLLDPERFEEALQDPDGYCGCIEGMDAIRELHRLLAAANIEDDLTFNRGWNAAKAEITAALGCDWEGIYLAAKEPWALKVAEMLATAKAEGAAEAYEAEALEWRERAGHANGICPGLSITERYLNRAEEAAKRAAAIRKGIEARAGGGK